MTRLTKLFALLLALALFAAACGDDDTTTDTADSGADETTVDPDDDMAEDEPADDPEPAQGEEDEPAAADAADGAGLPERIVSINPTGTEMLYAVGAGDLVVAVDSFSYYPEGTPVTDLSGWDPNVEAILSYEPDLVVMDWNDDVQSSLEAAGVTVLLITAPATFDDVYAQIEAVGDATGFEAEALEVVDGMRTAVDGLIADAPDASGLTYYHELDNTLYSVTSTTFVGAVYSLFGLTNVADPADADGAAFGYPQLSDEFLVDADPDLIFLADTLCCAQSAATVAERPGWDLLSAVQNGNVVELNDDIVSRWGPRLVDFVEAIAAAIESVDAG